VLTFPSIEELVECTQHGNIIVLITEKLTSLRELCDPVCTSLIHSLRFFVTQAAANRMVYEIKGLMTGDAKQGEIYFNGPGKCNTCHSVTGDFAGIAKRYDAPQLLAHIAYPATPPAATQGMASTAKPSVSQVTVTLASGEKVSGDLIHMDEFYVSLRDSSGWDRTISRDDGKVKVAVSDPMAFHKEQLKKYTDADLHNVLAYLETVK
jgi:cytochrome c oxidase cbb3-type subunit III